MSNFLRYSAAAIAAPIIALSGCATTLKPAPSAQLVGSAEDTAVSRTNGIEVIVDTDDWSAFPRSLDREMTPLRTTIVNNSDQPLQIRYENFALSGVEGVTYHPLPPIDIKGTVTQQGRYPVVVPRFAYHGFFISPYYSPYLTGLEPWGYTWRYDPFYYQSYYPRWEVDLPTHEMLELAIPEGVIEPKGRVSGFLYFPELDAAEQGDQITFTASLVNARTDNSLGQIGIPLVLE